MVVAGVIVDLVFNALGLIPTGGAARKRHRPRHVHLELHDLAGFRWPLPRLVGFFTCRFAEASRAACH